MAQTYPGVPHNILESSAQASNCLPIMLNVLKLQADMSGMMLTAETCRFAAGLQRVKAILGQEQYEVLLYKLLLACDFVEEWKAANAARSARFGDQNAVRASRAWHAVTY